MYKIASDEEVVEALKKVLSAHLTVNSQYRLKKLVEKELANIEPHYKVSGPRLRLLALNNNFVSIEIHARETDIKKPISKCPVCGSKLKRVKNQTIFGGTVTLGFVCWHCSYWTSIKRRVPIRYVFSFKRV